MPSAVRSWLSIQAAASSPSMPVAAAILRPPVLKTRASFQAWDDEQPDEGEDKLHPQVAKRGKNKLLAPTGKVVDPDA